MRFLLIILLGMSFNVIADVSVNEIPMYGTEQKNEAMQRADAAFLAEMDKLAEPYPVLAKKIIQRAWQMFNQKDYATSLKRFNQAWLLDSENGDIYHGFALMTLIRDHDDVKAEQLFKMAISKPNVSGNAWSDYGRFLQLKGRDDEAMILLQRALIVNPKTYNARSNIALLYAKKSDFVAACQWARDSQKNGDEMNQGFLDEVCAKAAEPQKVTE